MSRIVHKKLKKIAAETNQNQSNLRSKFCKKTYFSVAKNLNLMLNTCNIQSRKGVK